MISMDALHKVIDASQLTVDLEGTLHYDHSVWIELRCVSYSCHSYREKDKAIEKKKERKLEKQERSLKREGNEN